MDIKIRGQQRCERRSVHPSSDYQLPAQALRAIIRTNTETTTSSPGPEKRPSLWPLSKCLSLRAHLAILLNSPVCPVLPILHPQPCGGVSGPSDTAPSHRAIETNPRATAPTVDRDPAYSVIFHDRLRRAEDEYFRMSQQPPSPPLFIVSGEKWGTGDAGRPGTLAGVNRGRERMVALDHAAYPTVYGGGGRGRGSGGSDGSGQW